MGASESVWWWFWPWVFCQRASKCERERGLLLKFTLPPPPFGRAAGLVCIFELRHVCRKKIKAKMGFWSMKTRNLILIQRREGTFGRDHLILNVKRGRSSSGKLDILYISY
jgi:hypothetical protein